MKKYIALLILMSCTLNSSWAQQNTNHKIKIYETWILLNNNQHSLRGVLFEVRDSSVLVSNSLSRQDNLTGNIKVSNVDYHDIDVIKTRRSRNIGKGAIIGSSAGFGFGVISIAILTEGLGVITTAAAIMGGLVYGSLGVATGALIGSAKDRIPVKGSFRNFDLYRSILEGYSFLPEYPACTTRFEHKGYLGIAAGPSFPLGDFGETGFGGNIFLGYRFTRNAGIFLTQSFSQFPVRNTDTTSYWGLGGIMIGPVISIPVNKKLFLDMKPAVGYANAYLVVDDVEKKNGNGIAMSLNSSLTYNFSKRWGFMTEAGYAFTGQKFEDKSRDKFQSISLSFGFVYRFSRKSL